MVLLLVDSVTAGGEAGAPIEVVPPEAPVEPLVLPVPAVLDVSLPAGGGVGVVVALFSVVVVVVEDDVVGVGVWSRLVQAPRETAATSASAAHAVRDAFIGKLLEGDVVWKSLEGLDRCPTRTLGTLCRRFVGLSRRYL